MLTNHMHLLTFSEKLGRLSLAEHQFCLFFHSKCLNEPSFQANIGCVYLLAS